MATALRIVTRHRRLSPRDIADIESRVGGLAHFFPRIVSCEVHVEGQGAHHRQGEVRVLVNLSVPGRDIVISRQRAESLGQALSEAFRAAGRRLEDYARCRRRDVKTRAASP